MAGEEVFEKYTQWGCRRADAHHAIRTATAQAAFFLPYLRPGMRLLDCGCGPGTITVGFAAAVGDGEVVGVDLDEAMLERARAYGQDAGYTGLRFEVGNIYRLPFPDCSFDATYSHAVLEHLGRPVDALREMVRVTRPGGIVGVRIPDLGGILLAPANPLLIRSLETMALIRAHAGGDMYRGRHLRRLFREAGIVHTQASASYECHGTPDSIRAVVDTWFPNAADPLTGHPWLISGAMDPQMLRDVWAAWQAWADDPDAFLARPFCEAIGWRRAPEGQTEPDRSPSK